MPLQDLPDHLSRRQRREPHHVPGYRQLQREDRAPLLRLHAHDRPSRHRGRRQRVLPQPLARQPQGQLRLPRRGTVRPQAARDGRPRPRDRARPRRPSRAGLHEDELAHRPRRDRQDRRGVRGGRARGHDYPRHLLHPRQCPRQDRRPHRAPDRGPLPRARPHLRVRHGGRYRVPLVGRHDDAQHRAPRRDRLSGARPHVPRHGDAVRQPAACRQRQGAPAHERRCMGSHRGARGGGAVQQPGGPARLRLPPRPLRRSRR